MNFYLMPSSMQASPERERINGRSVVRDQTLDLYVEFHGILTRGGRGHLDGNYRSMDKRSRGKSCHFVRSVKLLDLEFFLIATHQRVHELRRIHLETTAQGHETGQ